MYPPHTRPWGSLRSWTWGRSRRRGACLWSLCPSTPSALSPGEPASPSPLQGPPAVHTVRDKWGELLGDFSRRDCMFLFVCPTWRFLVMRFNFSSGLSWSAIVQGLLTRTTRLLWRLTASFHFSLSTTCLSVRSLSVWCWSRRYNGNKSLSRLGCFPKNWATSSVTQSQSLTFLDSIN